MDLGQDKMVSGVVIQGGKHRDRNVFMKRFRVGHSLDGEDWTIVKEENTTKPKVGLYSYIMYIAPAAISISTKTTHRTTFTFSIILYPCSLCHSVAVW